MSTPRLPIGLYAYVGQPQHGKTTCAIAEQAELARSHGLVPLTIDSLSARNFRSEPHASNARAVCELVFGQARPTFYTPSSQEDFDAVLRACRLGRNVALLIDEISAWRWSEDLSALVRTLAHSNCAVLVTAQHVTGDLGVKFLSCAPKLRIFRSDVPNTLKFWATWRGLDPDKIRNLRVGEKVEIDL